MERSSDFSGRTCLVTGGARGLGRATAERLLAGGATVILCDKDKSALDQAVGELNGKSPMAYGYVCDVSDPGSIEALVADVAKRFHVEVLVNNAGYYARRSIAEITLDEWDLVMNINLRGVFLMMRSFMGPMVERKYGRIVNVASVDAYTAKPANCHYAVSKAGVVSLTKSFASELVKQGVFVNAVSPAAMSTETAKSQSWFAERAPLIPVGGAAEPESIAEIIAFLASEKNRFIVGEAVIASGGAVMI